MAQVFFLQLSKLLKYQPQGTDDRLLRGIWRHLLVDKPRGDERLLAASHVRQGAYQLTIVQVAVGICGLGQCCQNPRNEGFVLFEEFLVQADSRKHLLGRIFRNIARFFVQSGLLKVRTLGWALQGNLALLSTALRADAAVHSQAITLFFSQIADRTGQEEPSAAG